MVQLAETLKQQKDVTDSTADCYIRTLIQLNDKKPFKNLVFLLEPAAVMAKLGSYANSTRKNIVATITSVLSMAKGPRYKKAYRTYSETLKALQAELDEKRGDTMEKTEKETKNWIEWDDVLKKRNELQDVAMALSKVAHITADQHDQLVAYLLLCLYTYVPPRRNMDYQEMWVVKKWSEGMPTERNYLDLDQYRFIFNRYKTAKSSGTQVIDIPAENPLRSAIMLYLRHHPTVKQSRKNANDYRFLVKYDGTPMTSVNSITRVLNKVFGRRIGSSMLRHSYLSSKYGKVMEEMKEDAAAMAHDGATQQTYIRGSGTPFLDVIELV
jgi:hypothetical protein